MRTATTGRLGAWGALGAAVVIALSGCGSQSSTTASSASVQAADVAGGAAAEGSAASGGAGGGDSAGTDKGLEAGPAAAPAAAGGGAPALDNRQIIRTADLQIRLEPPAGTTPEDSAQVQAQLVTTAVAAARAQAIAAGGFVSDLSATSSSASMVIRVPVDQYDSFRTAAGQLGEVTSQTENAADVTQQYVDLDSRITTMKASIERVRTLLTQATTIADIVAIESELTYREAELESLQAQLEVLKDQVTLATISLSFTAVRVYSSTSTADDASGFVGGLKQGWAALVSVLSGLATVAGAMLPFLPVVLLIAAAVWLPIRRQRRSRTGQPGAAAEQAAPPVHAGAGAPAYAGAPATSGAATVQPTDRDVTPPTV